MAAGHDATEIGLLTELYWGMPTRTYVRTRAWTDAQLDAAEARLTEAGLMADGQLTDAGRAHREQIELATDAQMAPAIDALGGDLKELDDLLTPWATARHGRRRLPPVALGDHPVGAPQARSGGVAAAPTRGSC